MYNFLLSSYDAALFKNRTKFVAVSPVYADAESRSI